ncbi:MAG: class I SAM-dependent methyltransferase [Chloroflexi bacterium]|nr:class I SAM-dependent methyltransferase [Chloroflexota bacterium]
MERAQLQPFEACPVCGSQSAAVLVSEQDLTAESRYRDQVFKNSLPPSTPDYMLTDLTVFTNAYPARLVVCQKCGLVARDPRFAPQASIATYAQDDYASEWLAPSFEEYRAAFRTRMPELTARVGRSATVLEVGSYVGGFLAAAGEFGWRAKGVDVGRRVSNFARGKGLDVFMGQLADAHFQDESFDAVFVWACFDQLPDPRAELKEIRRVLKSRGWLFIQVPNGDCVKMLEPLARWPMLREQVWRILAYTGLGGFPYQFGYTPRTLSRLARACGFEPIVIRNRVNICESGAAPAARAIPEQMRVVNRVQFVCDLIYHVSLRTLVKGPWMEVVCRKQ